MNTEVTATALSTADLLALIDAHRPLAWHMARKFRAKNQDVPLLDLYDVAVYGLKLAAMHFDPSRGNKFITPAHRFIWIELLNFCRLESARGMHVPYNHEPYYAPRPRLLNADWQHPTTTDNRNDLGEDFWTAVARDLAPRDAEIILKVWRDGMQQKEVAVVMGMSKQRVGQIYQRAMERLKGNEELRELADGSSVATRSAA